MEIGTETVPTALSRERDVGELRDYHQSIRSDDLHPKNDVLSFWASATCGPMSTSSTNGKGHRRTRRPSVNVKNETTNQKREACGAADQSERRIRAWESGGFKSVTVGKTVPSSRDFRSEIRILTKDQRSAAEITHFRVSSITSFYSSSAVPARLTHPIRRSPPPPPPPKEKRVMRKKGEDIKTAGKHGI